MLPGQLRQCSWFNNVQHRTRDQLQIRLSSSPSYLTFGLDGPGDMEGVIFSLVACFPLDHCSTVCSTLESTSMVLWGMDRVARAVSILSFNSSSKMENSNSNIQ